MFLVFISFRFLLVGPLSSGHGLDLRQLLHLLWLLSFLRMDLAHLGLAFVTILIVCYINRLLLTKLYSVIVKILLIGLMYACLEMAMFCKNSTWLNRWAL